MLTRIENEKQPPVVPNDAADYPEELRVTSNCRQDSQNDVVPICIPTYFDTDAQRECNEMKRSEEKIGAPLEWFQQYVHYLVQDVNSEN